MYQAYQYSVIMGFDQIGIVKMGLLKYYLVEISSLVHEKI
jgi:hypothetical protein